MVWRRLPLRTFFVFAGVRDVPRGRGGACRCADTAELALEGRGGDTPRVSAAAPGPPASKIPTSRCSVPTPVLVVGAGGAGGEDDHLTGLIGESLEHHDALPPRRRRELRELLLNSLLPILGGA